MKAFVLRVLWIIGLPFVIIPFFPLIPLAMIGGLVWWIFTGGDGDIFLFGKYCLWNYPPLKWVDAYIGLYL